MCLFFARCNNEYAYLNSEHQQFEWGHAVLLSGNGGFRFLLILQHEDRYSQHAMGNTSGGEEASFESEFIIVNSLGEEVNFQFHLVITDNRTVSCTVDGQPMDVSDSNTLVCTLNGNSFATQDLNSEFNFARTHLEKFVNNDVNIKALMDAAMAKEKAAAEKAGGKLEHSAEESQQEETVAPTPQKESVPMEDGAEIDPRYLKYAVAKIRDYDLNKDGVLTNEEWSKSPGFIKDEMDADKDGKLTPTEYARALIRR
jgi:hypothetical protein